VISHGNHAVHFTDVSNVISVEQGDAYPSQRIEKENNMLSPGQLRRLIKEVLEPINLYSKEAEELLMLTAAQESKLGTYIYQLGKGPARGIFQMEPHTEKDLFTHFISHRHNLNMSVAEYDTVDEDDLSFNLAYQIVMARIHYLRVKEPLPNQNNIEAIAKYWKRYWNTYLGAGTIDEALHNYQVCVTERE
jgi:hypothetical protein